MYIIGIDPGLANTGIGIIHLHNQRCTLIDHILITTKNNNTLPQRLLIIYQKLSHIITQHNITAFAIESLFFAKNKTSALPVAHARGVTILCAAEHNIPVFEYTPNAIKSAVTGVGNASKEQVHSMIKLLLGIQQTTISHHVSDALASAICHGHTTMVYKP